MTLASLIANGGLLCDFHRVQGCFDLATYTELAQLILAHSPLRATSQRVMKPEKP